jgi:hypothetical protein
MIEKKTVYFEKPGKENTAACIGLVKEAVRNEGHKHIVVATTEGDTALALGGAIAEVQGLNIVAVMHSAGFRGANTSEVSADRVREIEKTGVKIFTGPMLTHSIETGLAAKYQGLYPTMLIAAALRRFGEGSKVCCEIVMMAVDAGLVPEGEPVLAVAGTGRGADTVLLIKSAASKRFLELRVLEILAKPGSF